MDTDTTGTTTGTITTDRLRITADQFVVWYSEQPEGEHYELYDGMVVRVPHETSLHGLTKSRIVFRLMQAIEAADLPCDVYVDAMSVEVAERTVFEPDVVVRSGERLPDRALKLTDPIIAVEVLSPSSLFTDLGRKRDGYLRVATLQHYLVVDADEQTILHFRRVADGTFDSTTIRDGKLTLDPPGITIDRLFA